MVASLAVLLVKRSKWWNLVVLICIDADRFPCMLSEWTGSKSSWFVGSVNECVSCAEFGVIPLAVISYGSPIAFMTMVISWSLTMLTGTRPLPGEQVTIGSLKGHGWIYRRSWAKWKRKNGTAHGLRTNMVKTGNLLHHADFKHFGVVIFWFSGRDGCRTRWIATCNLDWNLSRKFRPQIQTSQALWVYPCTNLFKSTSIRHG